MKKLMMACLLTMVSVFVSIQTTWALDNGAIIIDLQYNGGYAVAGVVSGVYLNGQVEKLGWDETMVISSGSDMIIGKYDTYIQSVCFVNPNLTYKYIESFHPKTEVKFTAIRDFTVHGQEEIFLILFEFDQFMNNFNYRSSGTNIGFNYWVTDQHCDNRDLLTEVDNLKSDNEALLAKIDSLEAEADTLRIERDRLKQEMTYFKKWDLNGDGVYDRKEAILILRAVFSKK